MQRNKLLRIGGWNVATFFHVGQKQRRRFGAMRTYETARVDFWSEING
jgi:hypothetical protein